MPEKGENVSCLRVKNRILITSSHFRLISYDIENEAYSYVGQQDNDKTRRLLFSSKEKLYLFEGNDIIEMNKQCEVLDRYSVTFVKRDYVQRNPISGGFFLSKGKAFYFDPCCEKKLTLIEDMQPHNYQEVYPTD